MLHSAQSIATVTVVLLYFQPRRALTVLWKLLQPVRRKKIAVKEGEAIANILPRDKMAPLARETIDRPVPYTLEVQLQDTQQAMAPKRFLCDSISPQTNHGWPSDEPRLPQGPVKQAVCNIIPGTCVIKPRQQETLLKRTRAVRRDTREKAINTRTLCF